MLSCSWQLGDLAGRPQADCFESLITLTVESGPEQVALIVHHNALDQLVQVNKASDNSLVATYTYNHDGTRRSKTTSQGTTTYNWDAFGNLVREAPPAASITTITRPPESWSN